MARTGQKIGLTKEERQDLIVISRSQSLEYRHV